jgi:uncharacterized membrane protein YccF (DUF307 family)
MSSLGNVLWFLLGGFISSILYFLLSIVLIITVIGIPFGVQTLKIAGFVLAPFGRKVVSGERQSGCLYILMNILWILFGGLELAILHLILALIFAISIIGIPFAQQHFKLAGLALTPFGYDIVNE